jgi:hypothetical protein
MEKNTLSLHLVELFVDGISIWRFWLAEDYLRRKQNVGNETTFWRLILGFRRDVDVICSLLGNYTASCGNYGISTREDGTDTLSRNVSK